jgi:hypothetical protein
MSNSEKENLRELLAGFMDEASARQAEQNIEKGDALLRAWPAPQPDEAILTEVRKRMVIAARRRQVITLRRRIWAVAGVAAAIVVISAVAMSLLERQPTERTVAKYATAVSKSIWESDDITADDADITVLAAEVETIENELSGAQLDEISVNGSSAAGDLETELIEISGDFWKG